MKLNSSKPFICLNTVVIILILIYYQNFQKFIRFDNDTNQGKNIFFAGVDRSEQLVCLLSNFIYFFKGENLESLEELKERLLGHELVKHLDMNKKFSYLLQACFELAAC